ncbi:MAG: DNA primase [Chloroflexi bacterium]|nr:DNA primase [Chloroflexota bacterium]
MSSGSPVEEIKDRFNILDIISPRVSLKKAGRNFKGLCPFHAEKTPSFIVFPDKGNYHCFGCGANGDIFTFVMKMENIDFGQALHLLAERAGITLPAKREAMAEDEHRARLRVINEAAAQYFHNLLLHREVGRKAKEYLGGRAVSNETIERFELGYALDSWDALLRYLTDKGHELADVVVAGLLVEREDGTHYDRFRGRLMFPIRDMRGNITGFGARALDDSQPKYLNSPETPLFDKGASLYGIDLAKEAIKRENLVIVVEGYIDVLIAHQFGINNVVASLGASLTERQIAIVKKLTKNLILALDADTAGDEATIRGLEVAKQVFDRKAVPVPTWRGLIRYEYKLDADIRIITLPRGEDPDEIIRQNPNEWRQLVEHALPVVDYYFDIITSRLNLSSPRDKSAAVERLLPVIVELPDKVHQWHYLQKLARLIQGNERDLAAKLERVRGVISGKKTQTSPRTEGRLPLSIEEYFLSLLLCYPTALSQVDSIAADEIKHPLTRQVLAALQNFVARYGALELEHFLDELEPSLQEFARGLEERTRGEPVLSDTDLERELSLCQTEIRRRNIREQIKLLEFLMRDAEEDGDVETLRQFIQQKEQLRVQLEPYEHGRTRALQIG